MPTFNHPNKESHIIHFKVEQAGYYRYKYLEAMTRPSGRFEYRPNHKRQWFEFWKPLNVLQQVVETVQEPVELRTDYFAVGDVILTLGAVPELVDAF